MQGSKLLKVVSIIMIVFGGIYAVLGLLTTIGGSAMLGAGADLEDEAAVIGVVAAAAGVIFILSGVLDIVVGVVGLKASKESGKHTAAFVLGILSVVFAAISLFQAIGSGGSVVGGIFGLVLPVLYLVGVVQTRS